MTRKHFAFSDIGRTLALHGWGQDSERTENEYLKGLNRDTQIVCLLCAILKELTGMNEKLDMLYPHGREEYRKQQEFRARRKREAERWHRMAENHFDWVMPVFTKLISGLPKHDLVNKLHGYAAADMQRKKSSGYYWAFEDYVHAIKGPPSSWDITAFKGLGPKAQQQWEALFPKDSD